MSLLNIILLDVFWDNVSANFVGSFISGIVLLLSVFFINEKLYSIQIGGVWKAVVDIDKSTTISGYQLDFIIHLLQKGNEIIGYGEKISETDPAGKSYEFETSKRVKLDIQGYLVKKYFGPSEIYLIIREYGRLRESGTIYSLKYKRNKKMLTGSFSSTAADSSGKVAMSFR